MNMELIEYTNEYCELCTSLNPNKNCKKCFVKQFVYYVNKREETIISETFLTNELKIYIIEKIDDVIEANCNCCMEDCDCCGLLDTMHTLKVALGIEKEDDIE